MRENSLSAPGDFQSESPEARLRLKAAVRGYLADWADEGHSIIPSENLLKYGFSGPWLRDLEEVYPSEGGVGQTIYVEGEPVKEFKGVWTLSLLAAITEELGIGRVEREEAAKRVGCVSMPIGRGTRARLYTEAIRHSIEH
jgi:hypothetical protein